MPMMVEIVSPFNAHYPYVRCVTETVPGLNGNRDPPVKFINLRWQGCTYSEERASRADGHPSPNMQRTNSLSFEPDEPALLTLQQTARSLAISKRTLDRLIAGGSFPAPLKIGRSSRVSRVDIAGYLEQLRRQRGDRIGQS